jgi:hypothetical protein
MPQITLNISDILLNGGITFLFTFLGALVTLAFARDNARLQKEGEFAAMKREVLEATRLQKVGEYVAMKENILEVTRLQKEGEFAAMKKDIAAVTQKQKEVENKLNVEMQNRISYGAEQRTAIILYVKCVNEILSRLGNAAIPKFRNKIRYEDHGIYSAYSNAESSLLLYIDNPNVQKIVVEVVRNSVSVMLNAVAYSDDDNFVYTELKESYDNISAHWDPLMDLFRDVLKSQHGEMIVQTLQRDLADK